MKKHTGKFLVLCMICLIAIAGGILINGAKMRTTLEVDMSSFII